MTRALVVVDVQNDFIESGSLAVEGGADVATSIALLINKENEKVADGQGSIYHDERGNFWRIYVTKDWHINPGEHFAATSKVVDEPDYVDHWPVHCVAGTKGAQLHSHLRILSSFPTFYKGMTAAAYSGFEGVSQIPGVTHFQTLEQALRSANVHIVDIVGLATDYCVKATALDAAALGFQTNVFSNYVAAVHPDKLEDTLVDFEEAGISWL
jgi:nicotinamidase/pyrazinamidase